MPSPFPGMDPFIEGQRWSSFHDRLIVAISDALVPQVRPRYVVDVEERAYLVYAPEGTPPFVIPDVMLVERENLPVSGASSNRGATATTIRPVLLPVPIPRRERETFLTLRDRASNEVVTVIEVLSPGNKRRGSDGQREYRQKRDAVLMSAENLVELDLLRGGERLPTLGELPSGDYYAFVHRAGRRPMAEIYAWSLREILPLLPVPRVGEEPDATVELQAVFSDVYDRGGYDYALDYKASVNPPVGEAQAEWLRERLAIAPPGTAE